MKRHMLYRFATLKMRQISPAMPPGNGERQSPDWRLSFLRCCPSPPCTQPRQSEIGVPRNPTDPQSPSQILSPDPQPVNVQSAHLSQLIHIEQGLEINRPSHIFNRLPRERQSPIGVFSSRAEVRKNGVRPV